jgi:hypothetical protein
MRSIRVALAMSLSVLGGGTLHAIPAMADKPVIRGFAIKPFPGPAAESKPSKAPLDLDGIALPDFAHSSFAGMGLEVNGIQVDQRIDRAVLSAFPTARLKVINWTDSQNEKVREDYADQFINSGNIFDVRDTMEIRITPWHAGSLIRSISREVSISANLDHKMPTETDYIEAVKALYGESPVDDERKRQIFQQYTAYRQYSLIYPIKDGKIANIPCWHPSVDWTARQGPVEKTAERALEKIADGWCDAILIYYFSPNGAHKGRIQHYGTILRDFKLEANATIQDVRLRKEETEKRQAATPSVPPKL